VSGRHDHPELIGLEPVKQRPFDPHEPAHYLNRNWSYQDASSHNDATHFRERMKARMAKVQQERANGV
jgi:hypothetical protein